MFLIRKLNWARPTSLFINNIGNAPLYIQKKGLYLSLGYQITKFNRSYSSILMSSTSNLHVRPASSNHKVLTFFWNLESLRKFWWNNEPFFLNKYDSNVQNWMCAIRKINPFQIYFYLKSSKTGAIIALSGGCFVSFSKYLIKTDSWFLQYPSGSVKKANLEDFMLLGRASNRYHKWSVFKSFSEKKSFLPSWRKKIKGLAQNPKDHPNGGHSKPKVYKNPWGYIAKKGK